MKLLIRLRLDWRTFVWVEEREKERKRERTKNRTRRKRTASYSPDEQVRLSLPPMGRGYSSARRSIDVEACDVLRLASRTVSPPWKLFDCEGPGGIRCLEMLSNHRYNYSCSIYAWDVRILIDQVERSDGEKESWKSSGKTNKRTTAATATAATAKRKAGDLGSCNIEKNLLETEILRPLTTKCVTVAIHASTCSLEWVALNYIPPSKCHLPTDVYIFPFWLYTSSVRLKRLSG